MHPSSDRSSQEDANPSSISDRALQFLANFQLKLFDKRNAVRHATPVEVERLMGHRFGMILFKEPTYCSQCHKFLWGPVGLRCQFCKAVSHGRCLGDIGYKCRGVDAGRNDERSSQHQFKANYFITPKHCHHCGVLMKGIFGPQGLECDCGLKIHRECEMFAPVDCKLRIEPEANHDEASEQQGISWSRAQITDFNLLGLIGTGAFSKVYLAELKGGSQNFAIKVLKKTNPIIQSDPRCVFSEKRLLQLGRNYPFLTVAHCCFQSSSNLFMVMEFVKGKDLVYHLRKDRKFTRGRTRFYAAELVLALRYIHKLGFVYRDLKLDNVILDHQGHCKLLDFGLSKEIWHDGWRTSTFCGTPSYISPEIINEQSYGLSVDWWALGVLMYEMLVGCSPFEASTEDQLYHSIVHDEVRYPTFLTGDTLNILEGLLTKDPRQRLGCQILDNNDQAILEHPFFKFEDGASWGDIEAKRIRPPYIPNSDELDPRDESLEPEDNDQFPNQRGVNQISQEAFHGFSFYSSSFNSMFE